MEKRKRISVQLPVVPHSLRNFIEKTVKDEGSMLAFVESPIAALRGAGVPIQAELLTKSDCDRIIRVLGNLRNLVTSGQIAQDFRFEQIFTVAANVEYEQTMTESEAYCSQNFTPDTECDRKSHTEEGVSKNWAGAPDDLGDEIIAPLLSPGNLAAIFTGMQVNINEIGGAEQ